jgi:long-chain fatty acid transport protein
MKRLSKLFVSLLSLAMISTAVWANGLSLNSVGTRAFGMGGAYVGLADDATAIYWNPAGLAGQQNGFNLFMTDVIPTATYKYDPAVIDAATVSNHYISPNFFANYNLGRLTLGLGAYVPAGLGAEWEGEDLAAFGGDFEWMSKIGVFNISPAAAYQVNEAVALGAAVNIYYGMMDMKRGMDADENGALDAQYEESSTGFGYGVSLSALWHARKCLDVGITYRTKTTVAFEGTAKNSAFAAFNAEETDFERDLAWPMWLGVGVAAHPMDNLTVTVDVQYSQWSDTEEEIVTDYLDPTWDSQIDQQDKNIMVLDWEDAIQYRLGAEYMATEELAVRAGYYNDPAPAPDETLNILFPSSSNHAFTGGLGYNLNQLTFDFGIEYLLGAERDVDPAGENMPGVHQMDIFAFSLGIGYTLP